MKCKRAELMADVQKYELGKGLEDGFELFSEIVTREWIVTDTLIKIKRDDGYVVSPFILNRRGREFIGVDDYIVIDEDGTRIRKDESYEKNYLLGKYGAIPTLKSIDFIRREESGT